MLKRLLPLFLILLLAIAGGVYLLTRRSDVTVGATENPALAVVPEQPVWILESVSARELLKTFILSEPLFNSLGELSQVRSFLDAFRKTDSLLTHNPKLKELYGQGPAVLSYHQTGKNLYQFLIIIETKGSAPMQGAGELFTGLSGTPGQWSQRIYNGNQVHRVTFGVDALIPGISLAEIRDFLLLSPSPILLENAVRQAGMETGIFKSNAFTKLSSTSGKGALASLYVNLKMFPAWISKWMAPETRKKVERFTRYGDWASLDVTIRNEVVWLNGFALAGDTANTYLNLFRNQEPGKLVAGQFLPSHTAAYYSLGIGNPGQYLKDFPDYLGGGGQGRKRQRMIAEIMEASGTDVIAEWTESGIRELGIGYLCSVADDSVTAVALMDVKSGKQTALKLSAGSLPLPFTNPDNGLAGEYKIFKMPYEGLPEILGGSFFSSVKGRYFSCIGNVLILADQVSPLEEVLHKYTQNKTLANDAVYQSIAGLISTRSNFTCYVVPGKAAPLLKKILSPESFEIFFANEKFILKTGAAGLQFNSGSGMSLHNVFASFAPIDYSKPQTVWESKLDAEITGQPVVVTNHLTREREIMVQDRAGNLCLLNVSGRILWKKMIGEQINSGIFQVDVLKNGRLQYLFSTPHSIHLIDRTGAYLPRYPVNLKLPATNGMALVDFDGTRDYRIFIACTDNRVYGFDKNGNPLKGWNFGPATGPITQPVRHFKLQSKDYLAFTDPVKVYIVDRKGAARVNPSIELAVGTNSRITLDPMATDKGPRFILTDARGTLHEISMDGSVETRIFGEYGPDHYFLTGDLSGDGMAEFIFVDQNELDIYSRSGEKIASRKFDGAVTARPEVILLAGNLKKLALSLPSIDQILLLNGDGTPLKGFPLRGCTPFTITGPDEPSSYQNLLVGSRDGYLFNYAIK